MFCTTHCSFLYSFLTLFINSNFEVGEKLWQYLAMAQLLNLESFYLNREIATKDVLRLSDPLENSSQR